MPHQPDQPAACPLGVPEASGDALASPSDEPINPVDQVVPDLSPSARQIAVESVGLFIMGILLAAYFFGPVPSGEPAGLPGYDSFYHVKMAALLPEIGLVHDFPWLRFVYFTSDGHFISHHYGFHVLLSPFVWVAHRLTGDYGFGGRWFIFAGLGASLVLFNLILIAGKVRHRWLFWACLLLLPHHFYLRQCYVRAINPSLVLMLALTWALFTRRALLAGLLIGVYIQVYLGALMYAPVIVVVFVASLLWYRSETRRRIAWIVACTLAGWLAGLILHPYASDVWEFLRLQVFGSGLAPDISVGREWRPYQNVWWFAINLCGPLWFIWLAALVIRARYGPPANAQTLSLLILHLVFLVLTLKARRFIEYWPMLALLSAAYLAAPVLNRIAPPRHDPTQRDKPAHPAPVTVAYTLTAALIVFALVRHLDWISDPRMIAMIEIAVFVSAWSIHMRHRASWARCLAAPLLAFVATGVIGANSLAEAHRMTQCKFDLPVIKQMMTAIADQSQPGDLIFTDDWDVFPVYFYFDDRNYYAVGLDPKFTQHQKPDLWERYVRITRGEIPQQRTVKMTAPHGQTVEKTIDVRLSDIRDYFGARFVICDRWHHPLSDLLAADRELAEPFDPPSFGTDKKRPLYTVFRIRPATGKTEP